MTGYFFSSSGLRMSGSFESFLFPPNIVNNFDHKNHKTRVTPSEYVNTVILIFFFKNNSKLDLFFVFFVKISKPENLNPIPWDLPCSFSNNQTKETLKRGQSKLSTQSCIPEWHELTSQIVPRFPTISTGINTPCRIILWRLESTLNKSNTLLFSAFAPNKQKLE